MTRLSIDIAGRSPACGGASLFIGAGGHITCSRLACPRPTAVDELINDLGPHHTVHLGETRFAVEHPLLERLEHRILSCDLDEWLTSLDAAPHELGWYHVTWPSGVPGGIWTRIPDPQEAAL